MAEIKYLEINADDRSIIVPAGENLLGVENDNEGARKYFRCPKIVGDGIDLTKSMCRMHLAKSPEKTDTLSRT